MALPFSKTTRQLQADRFGIRVAILSALILLMAVWVVWFVTADISLLSHSTEASLRTTNSIEANFPADDYFLLQVGQPARFVLNENGSQAPIYLSSTITSIEPQTNELKLRLSIDSGSSAQLDLRPGVSGRVEIETAQRTPLQLLMQYLRLQSTGVNR